MKFDNHKAMPFQGIKREIMNNEKQSLHVKPQTLKITKTINMGTALKRSVKKTKLQGGGGGGL